LLKGVDFYCLSFAVCTGSLKFFLLSATSLTRQQTFEIPCAKAVQYDGCMLLCTRSMDTAIVSCLILPPMLTNRMQFIPYHNVFCLQHMYSCTAAKSKCVSNSVLRSTVAVFTWLAFWSSCMVSNTGGRDWGSALKAAGDQPLRRWEPALASFTLNISSHGDCFLRCILRKYC